MCRLLLARQRSWKHGLAHVHIQVHLDETILLKHQLFGFTRLEIMRKSSKLTGHRDKFFTILFSFCSQIYYINGFLFFAV